MIPKPLQDDLETKHVVVVDDDDLFRESLGLNLAEAGFAVVDFAGGESALEYLLGGGTADAVLLDWRMPGLDGLGVLRRLRAADANIPVIFLTVLGDQIYEEAALRFGAVDFIEKSRRLPIILQRLKLIIEGPKTQGAPGRVVAVEGGCLRVGKLELYSESKRAEWAGKQLDLTLTEFFIVQFLAQNAGHDVSYRQIYDLVRGKDFVAGSGSEGFRTNVRAFIKRIRRKFKEADEDFDAIENYPGFGYRWERADGQDAGD
jgi:two-component system response regulator ChvI